MGNLYYLARGVYIPRTEEQMEQLRRQLSLQLNSSINDPNWMNRPLTHFDTEIFSGLQSGTKEYEQEFERVLNNIVIVYIRDEEKKVTCSEQLLSIEDNEQMKKIVESQPNFRKWMPQSFNDYKNNE